MPDREKVADIVADATKARADIIKVHDDLDDEIREIVRAAAKAKRPLSDADKAKRKDRRDKQKNLRKTLEILEFATLIRLDNSADIRELKGKLVTINDGLADDLKRLKNIKRYAEIAARIADLLAKLAEKGADLLL